MLPNDPKKVYNSLAMALMYEFGMNIREATNEFKKLSSEDKQYFEEHLKKAGIKFSEEFTNKK